MISPLSSALDVFPEKTDVQVCFGAQPWVRDLSAKLSNPAQSPHRGYPEKKRSQHDDHSHLSHPQLRPYKGLRTIESSSPSQCRGGCSCCGELQPRKWTRRSNTTTGQEHERRCEGVMKHNSSRDTRQDRGRNGNSDCGAAAMDLGCAAIGGVRWDLAGDGCWCRRWKCVNSQITEEALAHYIHLRRIEPSRNNWKITLYDCTWRIFWSRRGAWA